jgi:peptidyl-prolyl cis-trans isomerase C
MNVNSRILAAALAAAFSAGAFAQQPAPAQPNSPVLPQPAAIQATRAALVNGKPIPKSRVDTVVKQQAGRGVQDSEPLRKAIVDRLINFEVVVQEADKKGLTKNADLREQLELARQQVIFEAYMADYFKSRPISDSLLKAEYEKVKASRGDKEYKARHVLVESEAEAKDIIAQMDKGAKIEELAKKSKDAGSRDRGGDLNWTTPATFVKPFADALVKLDKGKYTHDPVQSQFGWHVIQLDDVRPVQFPAFDQVKPQLQNMVREQEMEKVVSGLRAKAKIE